MSMSNTDKQLRRMAVIIHASAATGLLAMFLGVWWASIRPIETQQYVATQRMAELNATLAAADDIRVEHASLCERLATVREQEASLQDRIPNDPAEEEFLALASKLADETGLTIKDYRPGKATKGPSCSSLQVQLIGEGGFASICGFLDGLSRLSRLSTVASLHVDATKNPENYLLEISVLLYFGAATESTKPPAGAPHA